MLLIVTRILGILLALNFANAFGAQPLHGKDVIAYRDDQMGFIFQYPKTWTPVPSTHKRTRIKIVSERGAGGEDCSVNVQVDDNLRKLSSQEAIRQMPSANSYQQSLRTAIPDATVIETGKTYLSNQEAVFYVSTFTFRSVGMEVPIKMIHVQTIRNGKVYAVACRASSSDFARHMPAFQIILAGFLIKN